MVVWPFLLKLPNLSPSQLWHWLFQPQPHVLLRSKMEDEFNFYTVFPELDMEAGTEFMIFNYVSRQVTCGLLKNLFTATQPSANPPSSQQHQWVGAKTIENPITTPKREDDGGSFCQCKSSKRQQMCPGPSWSCDHSSGPNCLCTPAVPRRISSAWFSAVSHWPLECNGWRIYFPTLFHLL